MRYIDLILEPGDRKMRIPHVKTVLQLLAALKIEEETAIVAREGKLLTPDRHIDPDDTLLVRLTGSKG